MAARWWPTKCIIYFWTPVFFSTRRGPPEAESQFILIVNGRIVLILLPNATVKSTVLLEAGCMHFGPPRQTDRSDKYTYVCGRIDSLLGSPLCTKAMRFIANKPIRIGRVFGVYALLRAKNRYRITGNSISGRVDRIPTFVYAWWCGQSWKMSEDFFQIKMEENVP